MERRLRAAQVLLQGLRGHAERAAVGAARSVERSGILEEIEHTEARRVGERLETLFQHHGKAPGREEDADTLKRAEASRKLARYGQERGSASGSLGALTWEHPVATRLDACRAEPRAAGVASNADDASEKSDAMGPVSTSGRRHSVAHSAEDGGRIG